MTDDINSNTPKPLENTHVMVNQNISHNNGNVNLSLFDQPTIFEHLTNDKELFNFNSFALDRNKPPYSNSNNVPSTNEESTNGIKEIKTFNTKFNGKPMTTNDPNSKNDTDNGKTTFETDDLKITNQQTTAYITPTAREALITKMRYHYGRKQSLTPSNFKKFQPPFTNGLKTNNTTHDTDLNNIEKIIIDILQDENGKMEKDNQPSKLEGLPKDKPLEQHDLNNWEIDKPSSDINNNKQKLIYTHTCTDNTERTSENITTVETLKPSNSNDENNNSYSKVELKTNESHPNTTTTYKATNERSILSETNLGTDSTIETSHGQCMNGTSPYHLAVKNPPPTAATPDHLHTIITPNISSNKKQKQTLTYEIIPETIPTTKTPLYNPYNLNSKSKEQNIGNNDYPGFYTPDKMHLHNNNLNKMQQNNIHTPFNFLPSLIQTSKDSTIKIQNLAPELEPLRKVIMSQHNALSQHIIDLGTICLNCTQTIEKKKNSSNKLLKEDNIPRSLRIKCDLTTSPDFENDPNYLILKQKLQDAVALFTTTGLEIMQEWSKININLLIKERCH